MAGRLGKEIIFLNFNIKIMKKLLLTLLIISTFFNACRKIDLPPSNCKLTAIDRGTGNKHQYTYNSAGKVIRMDRDFVTGPGGINKFVFNFTYNSAGLLISQSTTIDGAPFGTAAFVYTAGRVTRVNYTLADASTGVNNITYNSRGLISATTDESGSPADSRQYFEYDALGIMIKRGVADLAGNKFFEIITTPSGFAKSSEQLLLAGGLPFDVLTGMPWQITEGKQGTRFDVYAPNPMTGNLELVNTAQTSNVTLNARGFILESTSGSEEQGMITSIYTLTGCH
jgi:YD repeat-containing protein